MYDTEQIRGGAGAYLYDIEESGGGGYVYDTEQIRGGEGGMGGGGVSVRY